MLVTSRERRAGGAPYMVAAGFSIEEIKPSDIQGTALAIPMMTRE